MSPPTGEREGARCGWLFVEYASHRCTLEPGHVGGCWAEGTAAPAQPGEGEPDGVLRVLVEASDLVLAECEVGGSYGFSRDALRKAISEARALLERRGGKGLSRGGG